MKAEALAHKGYRTDLTSVQVAPKLATEQIAEDAGTSKDTIKRYIRLTNLIPEILQYVDDGRIAFTPAVELSYLNEQEQYDLLEQMELNDCTPSLSQACRFKKMSGGGRLDTRSYCHRYERGKKQISVKCSRCRWSAFANMSLTPIQSKQKTLL